MERFVRAEVLPFADAIERQETGVLRGLLHRAGELGLLAGTVPTEYGGLGLPRSVTALLYERAAVVPSFALAHNVHCGVGTLPLVWFGTAEQKARYLPGLATGERIGAFALSEANAGSDALAARCRAERTSDGGFRLTGTKAWITNAGFADLFTVFAKVDSTHLTAFLVPRDTPGLTLGREEEKMGLRGSSTRALFLDGVMVGPDAILGEIGAGHRAALYPLNIGRLNIAAGALGAGKTALRHAVRYARNRRQSGHPLADFGLIQHKLGEMAARLYTAESMVYRVAGLLDTPGMPVDEYAIECALVKVYATEALGYVVDEAVQVHGGYGFAEAYPVARAYRDARVSRIFEGTNEINRLTVMEQLARRVGKGRLDLGTSSPGHPGGEVAILRTLTRETILTVWEKIGTATDGNQETAAICTEMIIGLFAAESAWLRAAQLAGPTQEWAEDAANIVFADACALAHSQLIALGAHLGDRGVWQRLSVDVPEPWFDAISARRRLANALVEDAVSPIFAR
jgi:alkylation response protein AidB-like acyl-CoA dehydrogenase